MKTIETTPAASASRHTPEPWTVDYSGPARLAINGSLGETVAFCNLQNEDGDTDEANAKLIAAAPDLLAALEIIDANAAESVEWIRRTARAAIAKAKGGAL